MTRRPLALSPPSPPPGGTTETVPGDNTGAITLPLTPQVNLSIVKTLAGGSRIPGTAIVYQVVVANAGPSNVTGASVVDTLPAALTGATWTCSATAGSACGAASGSGNVNTTANLLTGGSATYVIRATINPAATGSLANSATASVPGGVTDPTPGNNTSTDTVTLTPQANLTITKIRTSPPPVVAGLAISYTLVVTNSGPSAAPGVTVFDPPPPQLISATWTCSASAGSSCGQWKRQRQCACQSGSRWSRHHPAQRHR